MWIRGIGTRLLEESGDGGGDASGSGGGSPEGGSENGGGNSGDAGSIMSSGGSGDAGAGGQGGGGDAGSAPGAGDPWYLAEGVTGSGDRPDWFKADKYKSVDEQAKALPGIEAKLGPAAELIGAPESGEYALPETVPDNWEYSADDPLMKSFQAVAKDLGLSQKAHDKIVAAIAGTMAEQATQDAQATADAIEALGNNADARVTAVNQALAGKLGPEAQAELDAVVGNNVKAFQALERLVGMAIGDAQLASGSGSSGAAISKADIEAEQYKTYPEGHKLAGKSMYEHDKEHRAKVDAMWKRLYPGEDRQAVG